MDWYVRSIELCAPWSYLLTFGQCILLAMLIERAAYLVIGSAINADMFLAQVRKLVLAGNAERALKLAAAAGETPLGRVCRAGLGAIAQGPFALQGALDQATAAEMPRILKRLPAIPIVACALAAVGVVGSKLLGATSIRFGGDGPLPFGLAMELAPALIGVTSCLVGLLGWAWLSRAAQRVIDGLTKASQMLIEVAPAGASRSG